MPRFPPSPPHAAPCLQTAGVPPLPGHYRITFDVDEYQQRVLAAHPGFFAGRRFYPAASVEFEIRPDQVCAGPPAGRAGSLVVWSCGRPGCVLQGQALECLSSQRVGAAPSLSPGPDRRCSCAPPPPLAPLCARRPASTSTCR